MSKKKKSGVGGVVTWASVSVVVIALLIAVTILSQGIFYSIAVTFLGGKKPILDDTYEKIYTSAYDSKEASVEAGNNLNVEIEGEGAVLLLNEDDALPIAKGSKVSVFGKNSVNLVLSGSGSGGGSSEGSKTVFDGLKAGGIEYNPTLKSFYESAESGEGRSANPALGDTSSSSPTLKIGEAPVANYTTAVRNSFREYSDAALVVISRLGGESWDLPRLQNTAAGGIEGNHYLRLDKNEYDLLDMVTARFDKVVILLNTLTSFQCDFIKEYNNTATDKRIDAVLWIGGPGKTGAEALGSLLNGDVNPSGKTTDIYSADFTKDPTYVNFGDNSQSNGDVKNTAFLNSEDASSALAGYNMITYEEGVYLGYRYYETRAYEELRANPSSQWYEENVIFPFGYGLSYGTEFEQEITKAEGTFENGGSVTIEVKTTNNGTKAGKDVVELYVGKPYTMGGIEKSFVELADFAKTDTLAPGASQTFTFTVEAYDLASYDYNDANKNEFKGYELEAGDYTFYISSDSHVVENAYDTTVVTLGEGKDLKFENDPKTQNKVENRFTTNDYDDIQYRLSDVTVNNETRKGMSRTDFERTFPTPLTVADRVVKAETLNGYAEKDKLASFDHNNTAIAGKTEMPATGKTDSELVLHDLLNNGKVAYDDARWDEILDKLTFSEMLGLVNDGAFKTLGIESVGKNLTNDGDGPIGFVNFMKGSATERIFANNTNFASEIVIGCTWNKDLAYRMGEIVGENGLWGDQSGENGLPYSGWYAPAVNLHRSPFSGRNFEYYSEDPILSGKMAVNVVNGARTKGVYTDLKHFALNDQETNRAGVSTFCTEQAFRELYLKPFEIAVKGDDSVDLVKSAKQAGLTSFVGTIGVMSSFNRVGNKWTGGDYRLLTEVLRNEWGFEGLVICDYKTDNAFMDSRQMLYAGNDLILTSTGNCQWTDASASDVQDVNILRQSAKNILFTVANSNSVQIKITGYQTEWWIIMEYVLDIAVPVLLVVWGVFAIRGFVKKKNGAKTGKASSKK